MFLFLKGSSGINATGCVTEGKREKEKIDMMVAALLALTVIMIVMGIFPDPLVFRHGNAKRYAISDRIKHEEDLLMVLMLHIFKGIQRRKRPHK